MKRLLAIATVLTLTACGPYTQADYDASAGIMALGMGMQNVGASYAAPAYQAPRMQTFCYPVGRFVQCY